MSAETGQAQTPPLGLPEKDYVKALIHDGRMPLVFKASTVEDFRDVPDTDYVCFFPLVRAVEGERIERTQDGRGLLIYSSHGIFLERVDSQILNAEDGKLLTEMIEDIYVEDMLSKAK